MLVTVENKLNREINNLAVISGGSGPSAVYATGGVREYALPYPFGHVGVLTESGGARDSVQLPMHPRDWRYKSVPWLPQEAGEEWQQLVQGGVVTMAFAAEPNRRDQEELFVNAV